MRKLPCLLVVLISLMPAPLRAMDKVEAYAARLDERVPEMLLRHNIPSAAVAVIHDGQTHVGNWGLADLKTGRLAANDTLYNVASISKVVTAWAVMRLVQEGKVDLDAPVSRYVSRWTVPSSEWTDEVTVRRLLSHTAGLSMPAVPQYGPDETVPTLETMLSTGEEPLRSIEEPGVSHTYSGGGFGVLQLLIEEVTGLPFADYVGSAVLEPLGMRNSTFAPGDAEDAGAAIPYAADLTPLPHYRFAATGAAGMYTTIDDLARFARASMMAGPDSPLTQTTVAQMQTPVQVEKPDRLGFGYGLGYSTGPLPVEGRSFGHAGSNDGWTALFMTIPQSGDALVVMINRSNALPVYRTLMCEWVTAVQGRPWPYFCDERRTSWTEDDTAFADSLFADIGSGDPAVSVLVSTADGIAYRKSFGSLELGRDAPASPESPFYIASLAKSFTALTVLKLAEEGRWTLSDPIGRYIPEVPGYARDVTLQQLLSHTSGIPDYYGLINWGSPEETTNATVISLLEKPEQLQFPAGSKYAYSNSGYVLLATAVERVMERSFGEVLEEKIIGPAGATSLTVYDGHTAIPEVRAIGYSGNAVEGYAVRDYRRTTIDGSEYAVRLATYGAGGMFAAIDDVHALNRILSSDEVVALPFLLMGIAPRTLLPEPAEIPDTLGHGFGWFLSRRYDTNIIWNTGDMAGHKSAFVRVPNRDVAITILASGGTEEPEDLALKILDRLLVED